MKLKLICEYDAEGQPYQKIQIPHNNQLPAEILKELELPEGIDFNYGVVIDGKAPNWREHPLLEDLSFMGKYKGK